MPSRVSRAQTRGRARTHTTADRARVPPPGRWLARGIVARAARAALADGAGSSGKRANGSRARQAARQQQRGGGRRWGASRNCTIGGNARVVRGLGRAGALRIELEPAANERIAPSPAANGQTVRARGGLRGSSSAAVGARGRARARASGSGARVTRGQGRARALRFERVPATNERGPGWAGLGRAPVAESAIRPLCNAAGPTIRARKACTQDANKAASGQTLRLVWPSNAHGYAGSRLTCSPGPRRKSV
jgi:hypothetical protein